VLGAFQVSTAGDLANWHTGASDAIPAGRRRDGPRSGRAEGDGDDGAPHQAGESKIVARCTYPLTGARCVDRIYTDLAVIDVKADGLQVVETVEA